ncbi:hypothetical protein BG004_003783, partial [Podila humilis]
FFLGSYIANRVRDVFLGYFRFMYLLCDGNSKETDPSNPRGTCTTPNCNHYEQFLDYQEPDPTIEDFYYEITGDQFYILHPEFFDHPEDYQLHPTYQTLVDQEPDDFPRRSTGPSYINLFRLSFIYTLSKLGSPQKMFEIAQTAVTGIEIGTGQQLRVLMKVVGVHMIYTCVQYFMALLESALYPGLTPDERRKRSVFSIWPRRVTRAVQGSLNSILSSVIVFSSIAVVGALVSILSVGIIYDVNGALVQTHERVKTIKNAPVDVTSGKSHVSTSHYVNMFDDGLVMAYDSGIRWVDPILQDAFPTLGWGFSDWVYHLSHVIVEHQETPEPVEPVCLVPRVCPQRVLTPRPQYLRPVDHNTTEASENVELWVFPSVFTTYTIGRSSKYGVNEQSSPTLVAINLTLAKFLLSNLFGYKGIDNNVLLEGFNIFNDLLFRLILFLLTVLTLTALKVSPIHRIGWIIDQALASSASMGSFRLSSSSSPGRILAKHLEFAITGTFIAMLKLSMYHTIFTVAFTNLLAGRAIAEVGASAFVPVRYAWITSFFGIVLTMFPIAPNWLVVLPGAIIHFYVYGFRRAEAVALVVGHLLFTNMVDSAVWDSHVVKTARPGISSAFWLGLWIFLGGSLWGIKGLLLGPVVFACIPAVWSATLELRGLPEPPRTTGYIAAAAAATRMPRDKAAAETEDEGASPPMMNSFHRLSESDSGTEDEKFHAGLKVSSELRRRIKRL